MSARPGTPDFQVSGPQVRRDQRRLAILLASLASVVLLTTVLTWGTLHLALRSLESVWHNRVEALEFLYGAVTPLERTVASVAGPAPKEFSVVAGRLDSAAALSRESWRKYLATTFTDDESRLVDDITPTMQRTHGALDSLSALLRREDTTRVGAVSREYLHAVAALSGGIEPLVRLQANVTRELVQSARARHMVARALLVGTAIATVILVGAAIAGSRGLGGGRTRRPT